jgi:hypothetical protein
VDRVVTTDSQCVTVTRNTDNVLVRVRQFDTRRKRYRTTVSRVYRVEVNVR